MGFMITYALSVKYHHYQQTASNWKVKEHFKIEAMAIGMILFFSHLKNINKIWALWTISTYDIMYICKLNIQCLIKSFMLDLGFTIRFVFGKEINFLERFAV